MKSVIVARNEKYAVNKLEAYSVGDICLCMALYDELNGEVDDETKIKLLGPNDIHVAMKNTANIFQTVQCGIGLFTDIDMVCISNIKFHDGAINIFLPGVAKEIAKDFDSDFYIVFLSIHEAMIHSVNDVNIDGLYEVMHKTMEETGIEGKERLSEKIYIYKKDTDSIEVAQKIQLL